MNKVKGTGSIDIIIAQMAHLRERMEGDRQELMELAEELKDAMQSDIQTGIQV